MDINAPLNSAAAPVASDSFLAGWGNLCDLLIIFLFFCCFLAMIVKSVIHNFSDPQESSSRSGRQGQATPAAGPVERIPMLLVGLRVIRDQFQGEECVICLVGFDYNNELSMLPICGHVFHSHCLAEWLKLRDTCPTCRHRVEMAPVFPIRDAFDCQISGTATLMEEV